MKKEALYPLQFTPIYKYRIWGGERLKTLLKKEYFAEQIGESWEISNVPDNETQVSQGSLKGETLQSLIEKYGPDFLGKRVFDLFGKDFPLLIKFIDAKTPLSIQVHPNDDLAKTRHNSFGKNEMWYIMEADNDAEIIVGFKQKITKKEYRDHLKASTITSVLNTEKVEKGDAFHIPTGRVHSIGGGILLAEIQQTSDITYRIYDYNRIDTKTGEKRKLHNDIALDAIDFKVYDKYKTPYKTKSNTAESLIHTPYFKSNILQLDNELSRDYQSLDSFVIFMVVNGECALSVNNILYKINYGQTILLPASINQTHLKGNATLLEIHL